MDNKIKVNQQSLSFDDGMVLMMCGFDDAKLEVKQTDELSQVVKLAQDV